MVESRGKLTSVQAVGFHSESQVFPHRDELLVRGSHTRHRRHSNRGGVGLVTVVAAPAMWNDVSCTTENSPQMRRLAG
jgi:hypothetical protein